MIAYISVQMNLSVLNFYIKSLSSMLYPLVFVLALVLFLLIKFFEKINRHKNYVGFFHPYANDGGGGERVLWFAIYSLQKRYPQYKYALYIGENVPLPDLLNKVSAKFGITIVPDNLSLIKLKRRWLVEAKYYPFLTMAGQCFGSIILALEAWFKFVPTIFIDTAGYAFAMPFFKYFGSSYVGCYVHYPIITYEMTEQVESRSVQYNNSALISKFPWLSRLKVYYYQALSKCYGFVGRCADFAFVNSSWTNGHILKLWGKPEKTHILYPPCDTVEFSSIQNISETMVGDSGNREIYILSLSQFRPEKDHAKQIRAYKLLRDKIKESGDLRLATGNIDIRLKIVGSCRNAEDEQRVKSLRELLEKLGVSKNVDFHVNIDFNEIKRHMARSMIGLHTMWNEHFGIAIVESMAAGLIMVAHNSGGPKMNIMEPYHGKKVGFLASRDEEYADTMFDIITMDTHVRNEIRKNAGIAMQKRFSNEIFEERFTQLMSPYMKKSKND